MESVWVGGQSVTVVCLSVKVGTYPSWTQYGLWLPRPSGWGSGLRLDWLSPSFHQWTGGRGGEVGVVTGWGRVRLASSRGCVLTATFLIWSPANHLSISSTAVNACVLYSVRGRERHTSHLDTRTDHTNAEYMSPFQMTTMYLGVGPPAPASCVPPRSAGRPRPPGAPPP